MFWLILALTIFLVIDCLILILLVLVQLPKKEAGMGQAFGGAATDALFGAGSGNALTKMTKYAAAIFFVLTMGLSILNMQAAKSKSGLESTLQQLSKTEPVPAPAPTTPNPAAALTATNAGGLLSQVSNAITATGTNAAKTVASATNAPANTNRPATTTPTLLPEAGQPKQ